MTAALLLLSAASSGYCAGLTRCPTSPRCFTHARFAIAPSRAGTALLSALPWAELYDALDELPCFVVVDPQRLAYTAGTDDRVCLHVDPANARQELKAAQAQAPGLGLRLEPVGLGFAPGSDSTKCTRKLGSDM